MIPPHAAALAAASREVVMPFGSLWLPVVVASVVVFFLSFLIHMVLRSHRADYKGLPNEDAVAEVMRKGGIAPGYYTIPYCPDPKQMADPAIQQRYEKGPVALIAVVPNGPPRMAGYLAQWFGFCLLTSFVCGYVARHTLQPGADPMMVLRITGTIAFVAHGFSALVDSIWRGIPWTNTVRNLIDGLVYALATGLTFRLLWPAA